MNPLLTEEMREVLSTLHYHPAISIIIPFEPKMSLKGELMYSLKTAADKVEKQLHEQYPEETCMLVIGKLRRIIKGLNYNTHNKSIAIYVSPVFEKVLYLNVLVEEKIMVDKSFEIRDLVYSKKQIHKYLVLILSSKESRIYLGNSTDFVRIVTNTPESAEAYKNDLPGKVANFSDVSDRREIQMNKFLHYVDNSLDIILHAYHLPLFVMGTDKILGHFKKLTKCNASVIEYIHGNYEEATSSELIKILRPYKADWKIVMQKNILKKLEEAAGEKRLVCGMRDVWKEASNQKGQLLVVEKNYMYAAQSGTEKDIIYPAIEPYNKFSYIKDAVDDVIEKVLETGGDIEFVENDMLQDYNHIALIRYY